MPDIILNGKRYKASDDALDQMTKDGVKFTVAPSDAGADDSSAWETVGDALRGGLHGATFGLADAKFGNDNQSVLERAGLNDYSDVQARSPVASTVGDVAGSLVSPLSKIGAAAKGANLAVRAGRAALRSAAEGGTRELASGGSAEDIVNAAGWSGLLGSALPLGGAAVGKVAGSGVVGKAADAVGKAAGKAADTARIKSFGLGATEMNKLAAKLGPKDLGQRVAADLEAILPPQKLGQTAEEKGIALHDIADKAGQAIQDSLAVAGAKTGKLGEGLDAFVPGAWQNVKQQLESRANTLPFDSPQANNLRNATSGFAERIQNPANPEPTTLSDFWRRVSDWGKEAYKGDTITSRGDTAAADAAEAGRSIGRQQLDDMMQYATPQTRAKFDASMGRYGDVIDYARAATKRGNVEAANSNLMGGAVAAGAPLIGLATAGVPGLLGGLYTAASSGTRNYLTQLLSGSRGFDVGANAGRGVQRYMTNVAPAKLQGMSQRLAASGFGTGPLARTLSARAGREAAGIYSTSDEDNESY